jgi:hypothetical protein
MRRMFVALAACLSFTSAAASDKPWEIVGLKALGLIEFNSKWQGILKPWKITFAPGRRHYVGMADPRPNVRAITVWVRPEHTPEDVADILLHELAHAIDWKYLTPALRNKWLIARGFPPSTQWFAESERSTDYLSGAGDFAESVAWTFGSKTDFKSCLGLTLSAAEKKSAPNGCAGLPPNEAQQTLIKRWLVELPKKGGE